MAADAAEGRIEVAHACVIGRHVVHQARAARVVEVGDRHAAFDARKK